MDLRAVGEIELQTDRRESGAVSCLASKCIDSRRTRGARGDHARGYCDWNNVERVLQREGVVSGERAAVAKRGDEEFAIGGFVFAQAFEDRGCFWGKAGPKTVFVVASFEEKRVVVSLCEDRRARANQNQSHEEKFHLVSLFCSPAKAQRRKVRRNDTEGF